MTINQMMNVYFDPPFEDFDALLWLQRASVTEVVHCLYDHRTDSRVYRLFDHVVYKRPIGYDISKMEADLRSMEDGGLPLLFIKSEFKSICNMNRELDRVLPVIDWLKREEILPEGFDLESGKLSDLIYE